MNYGYKKQASLSFGETIEKIKGELTKEGFGVLTEIDVQATLKSKLDIDYENYTILGACNPELAYKALKTETEIGLLLPCNIIVYEKDGDVFVSSILPVTAMAMIGNSELTEIARIAEEKLKKVIDAI